MIVDWFHSTDWPIFMNDYLIDWLIDWLIDYLIYWYTDSLIG